MNDYANAKQAYTASSVTTASPEQLVVMLYDGAIRFLRQAATAMRSDNREICRNRLQRADAIIDELNFSLDMSHGEIPANLRSIYLFCKRHLTEAVVERNPERIDETANLLAELRESWAEIASQPRAAGARAGAQ
jgi:flagellar protein FliS